MRTSVRIWLVVGVSLVLSAWTAATVLSGASALVVALPMVGTVWMLIVLDSGYLLGRQWAHRRRRRVGRPQRAAWTPAPEIRRPIDYPNVLPRPAGDTVVDRQGRFRATGIRLAVLPALAVTCLTVQTVFLEHGGDLGLGFVLAECLLLVSMVWTVWTSQEPSQPWVTSRVRAELFRREMFLLLAAVGPYLGRTDREAEQVRDARLSLLAASGPADLSAFARLCDRGSDGAESHWQDAVRLRGDGGVPVADAETSERMRTYLDYRIRRQSLFFELAAGACERTEDRLGRTAKATILAAVAVAVAYAVLLQSGRGGDGPSGTSAVVALLAAGLPPLCNMALAVQNLFASQRLAASYRETRQELLGHENTLRRLLAEPAGAELAVSFRSLVVRVESTLTEELRRWRIIVAKTEFEAGL
ncbi:hypothetical protein OG562_22385 [Streptomyces sp. NBC_01275]|uniref:hypothetical protein n=1 Tax=Streptomyces sp. NBC_01275 TaxID=2903807 RepID=UPI0022532BDC|nr:hypothetical protein [Streptomyces sp. NBC_01275]MCX4763660.1 hypothetical protein [Streptomyces sp. NBC_01275]